MKILYLGKFDLPYRTENYVSSALSRQGHTIKAYCLARNAGSFGQLTNVTETFQPDFVLFSKSSTPAFSDYINWCKQQNLLTVCWQWDLYWGYRKQRLPQFQCDLLFTTDGGYDHKWKMLRQDLTPHRVLRQGIHKPHHHMDQPDYKWDIGFVGMPDSYNGRWKLVNHLYKTYGYKFTLVEHTRGLDLNKKLSEIKVVVGDSYPSINYWSNRIYEILGRGGFLLHPKTEGLDAEFVDGKHYVSYERDNFVALDQTVETYLANTTLQETIRTKGWFECGRYTYDKRVEQLCQHVQTALAAKTSTKTP
jgi:spore maturation protein CgeB